MHEISSLHWSTTDAWKIKFEGVRPNLHRSASLVERGRSVYPGQDNINEGFLDTEHHFSSFYALFHDLLNFTSCISSFGLERKSK
jgi:hypothetical protein